MAQLLRRHKGDGTEPARHDGGTRSEAGLTPVRWLPADSLAGFDDIYQRMGQLMRDLTQDDRRGFPSARPTQSAESVRQDWWGAPPAGIEETDDTYVVELGLPGVDRDQLHLEVDSRQLQIHGKVQERERHSWVTATFAGPPLSRFPIVGIQPPTRVGSGFA